MKKGFLKLSVLLAALFIGTVGANAWIHTPLVSEQCDLITTAQAGEYNMQCTLKLVVDANATQDPRVGINPNDEFDIIFQLKEGKTTFNIVENEIELTAATDWLIDGEATKVVKIKEDGSVKVKAKYTGDTVLGPTEYVFATVKYQKDDTTAEDCGFAYGTPIPDLVCEIVPSYGVDNYYDTNGQWLGTDENAAATYYKECFACTTPDESKDGKYRDKDGKETDKAGYEKDCTNVCRKEDDKYYCKDGQECDKEKYDNECSPNPKSGSFIPYAGIAAGIILIATATIMVKKQSKLRKL